jgi:uncharacterized protein
MKNKFGRGSVKNRISAGNRATADENEAALSEMLDEIKRFARSSFKGARGSHDWEHTLRVSRLCERIGPPAKADMTVLMIAAYLHDIGRNHQDESKGAVCHAQEGVKIAGPMIEPLPLNKSQKENILHCIRAHRYRGDNRPQTQEARVLFDADKLDAIGAVGVARAFLFAGEVGAALHNPGIDLDQTRPYSRDDTGYREYKVKLSKISRRILTVEGRKLAQKRHAFMKNFFDRFLEEYEGRG